MNKTRIPLANRFWPKVNKTAGCWEWTGCTNEKGYGHIGEGGNKGRKLKAHRVSWEMTHGPVPEGMCVLHRCDNPPCVNPAHLFLGTRGDNFNDCLAKGRRRPGNPKMTDEQALAIFAAEGTHQAIADRFMVSRPTVSYIKSGSTWSHVTGRSDPA